MQPVHETTALITTNFQTSIQLKTKSCSTYALLREHAPMQAPLPIQQNNKPPYHHCMFIFISNTVQTSQNGVFICTDTNNCTKFIQQLG